jgi:acetate kinase
MGSKQHQHLLCLNAGSSSLKFKLFDLGEDVDDVKVDHLQVIASGSARPDGENKTKLSVTGSKHSKESTSTIEASLTSTEVVEEILSVLSSDFDISKESIQHISHRVVHGAHLNNCLEILPSNTENLKTIEFLTSFAPLHNASATSMIKSILKIIPQATNYACFDTAFHVASMDPVQYRYPVREDAAGRGLPGGMSLRKWGFHGLSYSSVTRSVSSYLGKKESELNLIICHLGSGASICAIKNGKSFDTSMGLTPLEGLPGSSRSGTVDPTLSHHILPSKDTQAEPTNEDKTGEKKLKVKVGDTDVDWAEYTLNKEGGFKALADTGDFAEIVKKRDQDEKCKLAFDVFVDRIVGFLGSYAFKLSQFGSVDALVFSGGIGEASPELRSALAEKLQNTSLAMSPGKEASKEKVVVTRMTEESQNLKKGDTPWLICKVRRNAVMSWSIVLTRIRRRTKRRNVPGKW